MRQSIGDEAAITFAGSFYRGLGFGHSVYDAFHQGIAALMLEGIPEDDVPQLITATGVDADKLILVKQERPTVPPIIPEPPFMVSGIENADIQMLKEHYAKDGFELMLPRFHDKDSLIARGFPVAYYPGTHREVWVMNVLGQADHIAMLRKLGSQ